MSSRAAKRIRGSNGPLSVVVPDQVGAMGDLTYHRYKTGRKRKNFLSKLLRTVTIPYRIRTNFVNNQGGLTGTNVGAIPLGHYTSTAYAGTSRVFYPVHLYPVTNIIQGLPSTTNSPISGYGLTCLQADNSFRWYTVQCKTPSAINAWYPSIENTDSAFVVTPGRKAMFDWFSLKLAIFGKTKAVTKVKISVVQFEEDQYCPEFAGPYAPIDEVTGTIGSQLTPDATEYWQSVVKPLISSPIASKQRVTKNPVKVLKSYYVNLDAQLQSTDTDQNVPQSVVDAFHRFERIMDYGVPTNDPQTAPNLDDPNVTGGASAGFGPYLQDYRKGIYIMITAFNPRQTALAATSLTYPMPAAQADYNTSYDINLITAFHTVQIS